ncbi:MAG: LURP-one-related/scramblase family protein [Gemmatimonadaceae bacterium]
MRYVLRQKLLAFGDDFVIKDEAGRDVYFVDGRAISIGDKLSFQDMEGHELAFIKQKLLSWGKTYEISREGETVAVVKRKLFTLFHHRFTVDVPGPDDLEAKGDFLEHEYTFRRGDRVVATVSKKWFRLTDTYGVDVAPTEDPVLILASAVVIDQACHPDDEKDH